MFPDEKFDFVYSYAVFQHIPSREVVFNYLREARRVLKTGGILRCQINGLPPHAKQYDTWSGVRIAPEDEIAQFARDQRLATAGAGADLDAVHVDHLPQAPGGMDCVAGRAASRRARAAIRSISNALTGEARGAGRAGRWPRFRCGSSGCPTSAI